MIKILLVDNHPLFRDGFAHMVSGLRPQWNLYFSESACSALLILSKVALDLIIVDVSLPGEDGFALLKAIGELSVAIPQILISGRNDAAVRARAQASGARGFIAKTAAPEQFVGTIDSVLGGATAFDEEHASVELPSLTARQRDVLTLLAAGNSNKEIRHQLNIAERTVRAHLTDLFQILNAQSRMQAIIRARKLGLID